MLMIFVSDEEVYLLTWEGDDGEAMSKLIIHSCSSIEA